MPEVGDHYVGAGILLNRGDKMARGNVVVQSCNANGNVMGRAHINPILDTGMYQLVIAGGNVTELSANITTESMYSQCDVDENDYLLIVLLVDTKQFSLQTSRLVYGQTSNPCDHCRLAN